MEEYLINEPFKKDEKTKQKFTDALQHCLDLINKNNNIHKNNIKYSSNNILTRKSALIGHEMYEFFKETMNELMIKKEIIEPHTEKIKLKRVFVKLERLDPDVIKKLTIKKNNNSSIDDQEKNVRLQSNIISRRKNRYKPVSQRKKLEIINLIRKNPTWTMRMIQEKSNCYGCQSINTVKQWIAKFKRGGSDSKLMNIINRHVYGKYIKFKRQNKNITDKNLSKWAGNAIEKYNISYSKKFELQVNWLERFKQIYCLSVPTHFDGQDDNDNDSDDDDSDSDNKRNSSDNANKNDKETNSIDALDFNEIDELSIERSKTMYVSFEDKKKVIDIVRQNPTWTLGEIIKRTKCKNLNRMTQLSRWAKSVDKGVNFTNDMNKINNWVYKKCLLYKKRKKKLSNELIIKWGLEAKNILLSKDRQKEISFAASGIWLYKFKKKYNIKGRNSHELQIVDEMPIDEIVNCHSKHLIIPYETKLKIINTKRENPGWTLKMIKKHCGYNNNLSGEMLCKWKKHIDKGGTVHDKMKKINNWVYQKCIEHKKNNNQLSFENIREFGRQAHKVCYPDKKSRIKFTASKDWGRSFNKLFGIVGRSPNLIITNKSNNDEISDTTEAPNEESPVAEDESDDSSVESNDKKNHVTYDDKIRVIKLARQNPTWTIQMLRQVSGVKTFRGISTLDLWKKQIKNGGTERDKARKVNQWLDNKVNEYKSKNKKLTREIIQGFLDEAEKSLKIKNLSTTRGESWWISFEIKHNLKGKNCYKPIINRKSK